MSIKKNIIYSNAISVSSLLFPLLTFPYVSRVLGPEGIGSVSFMQSYSGYFVLFAALGINIYGQREVAQSPKDRKSLSEVFNRLFFIHIMATMLFGTAFLISSVFVQKIRCMGGMNPLAFGVILGNVLNLEWFFRGVEDFRYITLRALAVRTLVTILTFILVRHQSDAWIYFSLTFISVAGGGIFNLKALYKHVNVRPFAKVEWRSIGNTLKAMAVSSVYMILTNVYSSFPLIYLGFMATDRDVGEFSTAFRLLSVIMMFFTATTTALFPRMSAYLADGDMDAFRLLIHKSFTLTLALAVPLAVGAQMLSDSVILILAGKGFKKSGEILRLLSWLILVIPVAQIYVSQILHPMRKESKVLVNTAVSACLGLVLNFVLVPKLGNVGTSWALVLSETVMTFLLFRESLKTSKVGFPACFFLQISMIGAGSICICWLTNACVDNAWLRCGIAVAGVSLWTLIAYRFLLKDVVILEFLDSSMHRIVRRFGLSKGVGC